MEEKKLSREEIALHLLTGLLSGIAVPTEGGDRYLAMTEFIGSRASMGHPERMEEAVKAIQTAFRMADLFIAERDKA